MANRLTKFFNSVVDITKTLIRPKPSSRPSLQLFPRAVDGKQLKVNQLNERTLKRLADTDPIIWSIRHVIKGFISQTKWAIVTDTQDLEMELERWEDAVIASINPYDIPQDVDFEPKALDEALVTEIQEKLDVVLQEPDLQLKRDKVRWIFDTYAQKLRRDAEAHTLDVKQIFEHPNPANSSFRSLLELVLEDLLVFDAGAIVKNYDYYGNLAELYTIPAQHIRLYRNDDGTVPEPPQPAYSFEPQGFEQVKYSNDELVYIVANPQHEGYGLSPLSIASYIIMGSLYADEYNMDYFKHSNIPPGIINLGHDITEEQVKEFKGMWEQELRGQGGMHKIVVTGGSDKLQFIPVRPGNNRDMQMMEYIKWTAKIKCACYGLSLQDIGLTDGLGGLGGGGVANVQKSLSQARGIRSILNLLESYINQEIVKTDYSFKDVKFEWNYEEGKDSIQQAQVDKLDIDNGVISINERRKKLGIKPIDGGDIHMIKSNPAGFVPVNDFDKISDPEPPTVNTTDQMAEQALLGEQPPGPDGESYIQDDSGRPPMDTDLNLFVNKKLSHKKQMDGLNKTIQELRKNGVKATIKIGFTEDLSKDKKK